MTVGRITPAALSCKTTLPCAFEPNTRQRDCEPARSSGPAGQEVLAGRTFEESHWPGQWHTKRIQWLSQSISGPWLARQAHARSRTAPWRDVQLRSQLIFSSEVKSPACNVIQRMSGRSPAWWQCRFLLQSMIVTRPGVSRQLLLRFLARCGFLRALQQRSASCFSHILPISARDEPVIKFDDPETDCRAFAG